MKAPDAFRTISEVAEELDVPQHVLRFWETRFAQIKPLKRGGGRRYYRPDDVALVKGIRHLLYGEGYTIKGVQRILKTEGVRFVQSTWREGAMLPAPALEDAEDEGFGLSVNTLAPRPAPDSGGEAGSGTPPPVAAEPPSRHGQFPGQASNGSTVARRKLDSALAELAECRRVLSLARRREPDEPGE